MQIDYDKINTIDTKNLDIFKPNQKLYFALAQKDKVDFIYNTSALEGNAMTYPEVATLLEGITIGGHKVSDEQQILNQNRSVSLLFELIKNSKFKLDKLTLLKLHKKVSRLMMNGILLDNGYPILNIKAKDKLEFNQIMIKFYDTQNIYDAIDYLQNYYYNQNKTLIY